MRVMVTARELIDALQDAGAIDATIVDSGDLYPRFGSVEVEYDDSTGEIAVVGGRYYYAEDSCHYGVDPGESEATVCGVTFSKPILGEEDAEIAISGDDIDYDYECDDEDEADEREILTEEDVLSVAADVINFPSYDADDFPFDISDVDDCEIEASIDNQIPNDGVFLETADGRVLCMEGCTIISRERAIDLLVEQAKEVDFDVG
jgi:hypothetical protein